MKTQSAILLGLAIGAVFIMATNKNDKKLTIKEAAKKIGSTEAAIRGFMELGALPFFLENGQVYILESSLDGIQTLNK